MLTESCRPSCGECPGTRSGIGRILGLTLQVLQLSHKLQPCSRHHEKLVLSRPGVGKEVCGGREKEVCTRGVLE